MARHVVSLVVKTRFWSWLVLSFSAAAYGCSDAGGSPLKTRPDAGGASGGGAGVGGSSGNGGASGTAGAFGGSAGSSGSAGSQPDGGSTPAPCTGDRQTHLNHGSEGFFACAASAGKLGQCWGEGFFSPTPKELTFKNQSAVSGAVQFAAVGYNGCVLLEGGAVHCFTSGDQGQARPEPVVLANAVQISGGYQEACALIRPASGPGSVQCWKVEQWTPPTAIALDPADAPIVVAAGYHNGCVVLATGIVKCWGANGNGQLGSGAGGDSTTPKATLDLGGKAISVTVGNEHVCALLEGGAVKCWGQYNDGKLGYDTAQNQSAPGQATISAGAIALAAGKWHTCAIMQDRSLKCWGKAPIGSGPSPVTVPSLSGVVAVNGGRDYACVITELGALKCWGSGGSGSLGHAAPTDVPAADGMAFKAGAASACP